ncbi:ABC transporter ATP-binding protein [Labrys wisconsinensis]|uniref:Multiple sugar transport system ATP-binding protein n=1 Tax=Labrys wisconsinensis TaxID=425677 RepID=A0ABU0IYQ3_9HYPH|nr:ABC transporter ATP-binding protein [Labrys wisconsinensis]MDQ0467148.1 multiple sugar transport system ATP-binding protein [Labrys wisconsinensis]
MRPADSAQAPAAIPAPSVAVRDLAIRYGAVTVLDNLRLEVAPGEFIVLLGPSGCGKSTLLNAIAGLIDISDGEIWISGRNVTWAEPAERGIGMVFQSYALYPRMTVAGNMSFGLRMAGLPRAEIAVRVAKAAKMLQLEPLLQRRPAELSGGQRQRVAIGRALVRNVDVFLFDEPLSNLDAKLRNELRVEIKKLHQELGNTMIYVTHDQIEALTLADRIAVMKGGVIQQLATPHDIYHQPANQFVAGFIGSPTMNFWEGRLAGAAGGWRFEGSDLAIDLARYPFARAPAAGPAVLGMRPEHIGIGEAPPGRHAGRGLVTIVEPMGADTVVWTEIGGKPSTIRLDGDQPARVGDAIPFHFDPARASLFDAQAGTRL